MKKTLALLLIAAMLFSLSACGAKPAEPPKDPVPAASEAPAAHYPITLTDQAGREITVFQKPQRLVSAYYISTSLLIALGLQDRMAGMESNASKRPIYQLSAPELLDLPGVGSAKEFDLEGCAALEPDLVILPLKLKNAAETLESLGIPVLLINPESHELLAETIRLVAAATDTEPQGEALLSFISEQESCLSETLADAARPRVYLAGNSNLLSTAGEAMYQSSLIRLAGGENVAAELPDTYWAEVSYEQLLAWDPDYIVLASDAKYSVEDVLSDPNLADCTAVVSGNVVKIPGDAEAWDSPVPGGILGSVWLSGILHPDLFPADTTLAVINEYYETFYGFQYA